jgi:hypothetical protein
MNTRNNTTEERKKVWGQLTKAANSLLNDQCSSWFIKDKEYFFLSTLQLSSPETITQTDIKKINIIIRRKNRFYKNNKI